MEGVIFLMNSVELANNDVYFMEVLEDIVVINDNYCGFLLFNSNLEQICRVKIFEGLSIYSSFKHGRKILLFCPENNCLVYFDLNSNEKKIISLKEFEGWIFSPLYIWYQNNVILSDYNGHFVNVDLKRGELYIIDIKDMAYQDVKEEVAKLREFQIYKICSRKKKRAIIYFQESKVRLIDYDQEVKVINEFEREQYYDYDWNGDYITKISEDKVEIIHGNSKTIYSPAENYNFLKGRIMGVSGDKYFFLLSALKSDDENSKIEKIKLNGDL